ncbi:MAG: hypothetical protein ABI910_17695 [Gemmatimonadota bacterium]
MFLQSTVSNELRAKHWSVVLRFEEGSLPASEWCEETLTLVASWYAKHLTPDRARARYEKYYLRNRHRLSNRLGNAPVATESIEAVHAMWESLLQRALDGAAA